MAVTLRFLSWALALTALLVLADAAYAGTPAECSICATDCYGTYSDNVEECGIRLWCQHVSKAERDACITGCITEQGCDSFEWFPKPGEEVTSDFWSSWLI